METWRSPRGAAVDGNGGGAGPQRAGLVEVAFAALIALVCVPFPILLVTSLLLDGVSDRSTAVALIAAPPVTCGVIAVFWWRGYGRLWAIPVLAVLGLGFWPALLLLISARMRRELLPTSPTADRGATPRRSRLAVVSFGLLGAGAAGFAVDSIASSPSLPIREGFGGACPWPVTDQADYALGCAGGVYRIRFKAPGVQTSHSFQDYHLDAAAAHAEIDVRVASGRGRTEGNANFGIGCLSGTERVHGYFAVIGTDGTWGIARLESDFVWIGGTNSPGAITGLTATTRLGITCASEPDRTLVGLWVNGRLVGAVTDAGGYDRFRGFGIWTATYPGDVLFDRFVAQRPTPGDVRSTRRRALVPVALVKDSFGDHRSGWSTLNDWTGTAGYHDGRYRLVLAHQASRVVARTFRGAVGAVRVEASALPATGPKDPAYGLTCGSEDGRVEYEFQVARSGGFEIYAVDPPQTRDVARGSVSIATPDRPLRMAATCVPHARSTQLMLRLNGALVSSVVDPSPLTGSFDRAGLLIHGARGSAISFDDFAVQGLSIDQATADASGPITDAVPPGPPWPVPHMPGTLLAEDFTANRHEWPLERTPATTLAIHRGRYDVRVAGGNALAQPSTRLLHPSAGIIVDAHMTAIEAPYAAGIGCVAGGRSLLFLIDAPARRYSIWTQNGDSGAEIESGRSAAIHRVGVNHLRARCGAGSESSTMIVNDHRVAIAVPPAQPASFDHVMLWVEAGRNPARVSYDDVTARSGP